MTARERQAIKARRFDGLGLAAAAAEIGVSRERVRQLEAKALRKLHHPSAALPDLPPDHPLMLGVFLDAETAAGRIAARRDSGLILPTDGGCGDRHGSGEGRGTA